MIEEIEDKIYKLEGRIADQHLVVGEAESEVDDLQVQLDEAEENLNCELKDLEEMEDELTELQDQLEKIEEGGESDTIFSYGAGQTQEETLFDFI